MNNPRNWYYLHSEHEGIIVFIQLRRPAGAADDAVLVRECATGNVQVYAPKRAREIWNHRVKFGFRPYSNFSLAPSEKETYE